MTPVVGAAQGPSRDAQLAQHRNLGKAFYENPTTREEAVEELRKALELAPGSARERLNYGLALLRAGKTEEGIAELRKAQTEDPSIPHSWFNLGIAYERRSEYAPAIAQLEGMVERVPDEPITHYNLGVLYKLRGDDARSLRHFERAAALDPELAGPHFQLATAYRRAGRDEDSRREMERFREIKRRQVGAPVPEDLEWSRYAELYEPIDPAAARPPAPVAEPVFAATVVARGIDPATAGLTVLDADADGVPDLLARSAAGVALYRGGRQAVDSGLAALRGVVDVAPGDFDDDGLADLAVVRSDGPPLLFRNRGGSFAPYAAALPDAPYALARWLDYDHDYDLDLLLLGDGAALVRNQGTAGFAERSADFPFARGRAVAAALFDLVADSQGRDLAVAYADRPPVLYRDRLAAGYEATPLPALPPAAVALAAADVDDDGWTDLVAGHRGGVTVLANDRRGELASRPAPEAAGAPFLLLDVDNRGVEELLAGGGLLRRTAPGSFAPPRPVAALAAAPAALAAADFDGDGRLDLAAVGEDGALRLLTNRTATPHHWLAVGLEGVKNLKLAAGAEVEVKAGASYQKRLYRGVPLHFGLGDRQEVDAVRIGWPNGLIQNETRQATDRTVRVSEAPRLSGSCPMVFTWDGEEMRFITDVLGVAPLGAAAADGEVFPVDHDEVVSIPGDALAPLAGRYEVRITEELREVTYLDQLRLAAVDHPAAVELLTNEKFKGPPFPQPRLYGVERRIPPRAARDERGRDVRDRLLARDGRYPDGFAHDLAGVAALHTLELDFGDAVPDGKALLVLSGWVDWADGSTFRGVSQERSAGLAFPSLQVEDGDGWRTVIEDMGFPAGKPKTIVVDLTDRLPPGSRRLRIVTSLCIYWDEIYLAPATAAPESRRTELPVASAELRFRGFSRVVVDPARQQPERFLYAEVRPVSMWNPTPGLYTRYGDVRPLVTAVDDRFVVMGSGDELRVAFDAAGLPALPVGWRRDFLLTVDGWAKDGDANTAHSQTVGPLPYHAMPGYPYAAPAHYPDDPAHTRYRERYNTRPALRLIRPLSPAPQRAAEVP